MDWAEFESDYKDACYDVQRADYKTHDEKLKDFFRLLDAEPLVASHIKELESLIELDVWQKQWKRPGGMVGSGQVVWSSDRIEKLAQHLTLFRHFSETVNNLLGFSRSYMYADGNFNSAVQHINEQLFDPLARDLLKDLTRQVKPKLASSEVPASDRIVTLDHNQKEYTNLQQGLSEIKRALLTNNELSINQPEERDRIVAEIDAAQSLLNAPQIKTGCIRDILLDVVQWVQRRVGEKAGDVALASIALYVFKLLGIDLPLN